jgi:hypothetical protein
MDRPVQTADAAVAQTMTPRTVVVASWASGAGGDMERAGRRQRWQADLTAARQSFPVLGLLSSLSHRVWSLLSLLLLSLLCVFPSPIPYACGALVVSPSSRSLGLEQLGPRAHVAAVGDLDGDKHADVFVINSQHSANNEWSVETWMWKTEERQYRMCFPAACSPHARSQLGGRILILLFFSSAVCVSFAESFQFNSDPSGVIRVKRMINNVVPGDFDHDVSFVLKQQQRAARIATRIVYRSRHPVISRSLIFRRDCA